MNDSMQKFMVLDQNTFGEIMNVDQIIYLGGQFDVNKKGQRKAKKVNFGFVFSTKRLLIDIFKTLQANHNGVNGAFDGTHQLCKNKLVFSKLWYHLFSVQNDRMYRKFFDLHSVCLMQSETIFGFCKYTLIHKNV